jgi:uncharacterized RDD family membrane protein YckC
MSTPASAQSLSRHDDERELLTGEAVALELRATNVILRAVGAIIDYVVYATGTAVLVWSALVFAGSVGLPDALYPALGITCVFLGLVLAPAVVESATQGKSLGRWALGSRIVRDDGGAIGFRHAFIRSFVGLFEIVFTGGGLAIVVGLLNARAKRLGDLVAGTYSQYERVPKHEPVEFGVPIELTEWAVTADVARIPDTLSRRIAQFLRQAGGHTPQTRARLAASLANEVAPFVSPRPAVEPELLLAGVAVLRREREARALQLERARLDDLAPTLAALPHGFPDRG